MTHGTKSTADSAPQLGAADAGLAGLEDAADLAAPDGPDRGTEFSVHCIPKSPVACDSQHHPRVSDRTGVFSPSQSR